MKVQIPLMAAATLFLFAGCGSDDKESGDTEETDTNTQTCDIELDSSFPTADQADFYYKATLEFELSDPDPEMDPTVALTGPAGDVAGQTFFNDDKSVVYFTPSAPLSPSTAYTATLTYCRGDLPISFSTSALGETVSGDLTGNTYKIDLGTARFIEPADIGPLISQQLTQDILIGITGMGADTIDMMGALSVEGSDPPVQDTSMASIIFPSSATWTNPFFNVGPADTTFNVAGVSLTIYNLQISGTFAADGSYFGGGGLSGEADARDIVAMFPDQFETADEACELVAGFGAPCVACSSDGAPYCLNLVADSIKADLVPGLTLVVVKK